MCTCSSCARGGLYTGSEQKFVHFSVALDRENQEEPRSELREPQATGLRSFVEQQGPVLVPSQWLRSGVALCGA